MLLASETKSTSYQVGITHNFSETMLGNLSVGTWHSDAQQLYRTCPSPNAMYISPTGTPLSYPVFGGACLAPYVYGTTFITQSTTTFNGGLETQIDNTHVSANVSRSLYPGSSGDQVRTDNFDLGIAQNITAKLKGNLSISAHKYTSETGGIKNFDRTEHQIAPSISWYWSQELLLNMTYRYTSAKRSWEPKPVISNYMYVDLVYQ